MKFGPISVGGSELPLTFPQAFLSRSYRHQKDVRTDYNFSIRDCIECVAPPLRSFLCVVPPLGTCFRCPRWGLSMPLRAPSAMFPGCVGTRLSLVSLSFVSRLLLGGLRASPELNQVCSGEGLGHPELNQVPNRHVRAPPPGAGSTHSVCTSSDQL